MLLHQEKEKDRLTSTSSSSLYTLVAIKALIKALDQGSEYVILKNETTETLDSIRRGSGKVPIFGEGDLT